MTTMGEQVVAEVLTDMRLHGFTMLRPTTHGALWGFQRFRISIPNNLKDKGHNSTLSSLRKQWDALKSEMYGELPGYKASILEKVSDGMRPSEVDNMQPIEVIEPPPEPATVRSNGARKNPPWTCPNCKRTFSSAGRHAESCTGESKIRTGPGRKQRRDDTLPVELSHAIATIREAFVKLQRERNDAVKRWKKVERSLA